MMCAMRALVVFFVTFFATTAFAQQPAAHAYMLTSSAADLAITQLVDGNKGVHAMIPKSIFR